MNYIILYHITIYHFLYYIMPLVKRQIQCGAQPENSRGRIPRRIPGATMDLMIL